MHRKPRRGRLPLPAIIVVAAGLIVLPVAAGFSATSSPAPAAGNAGVAFAAPQRAATQAQPQVPTPAQLARVRAHAIALAARRAARRRAVRAARRAAAAMPAMPVAAATPLSGTLGCSGLEALWDAAGGAPSAAVTAASVAMAESGGNQFAVSPTDDIGYWQINAPSWGSMASTDPMTNARAAVQISGDGSNWSGWTAYTSGAYAGLC